MTSADSRRPRRVYAVGSEPDPRFTFANERTFLAWIRTALALLAAGLAVEVFLEDTVGPVRRLLAAALVLLGSASAALAYVRWMASERALRRSEPLPSSVLLPALSYGLAAVGVAVLVVALVR